MRNVSKVQTPTTSHTAPLPAITPGVNALPLHAPARGVYDAPDLVPDGGMITLPADGPSLRIWRLGGPEAVDDLA